MDFFFNYLVIRIVSEGDLKYNSITRNGIEEFRVENLAHYFFVKPIFPVYSSKLEPLPPPREGASETIKISPDLESEGEL